MNKLKKIIDFPRFTGIRCLMMPYIQGEPKSVTDEYALYRQIIKSVYLTKGEIGFLTIDESPVVAGSPHRGARARYNRALHTEVGKLPNRIYKWGGGGWGTKHFVTLSRDVRILLANNLDDSCAIWDDVYENTSVDGDIGHVAFRYPYKNAIFMKAGEVCEIGILTPHESLPVRKNFNRQFLRIVSSEVCGREEYFTKNPLIPFAK